MAIVSIIVPVYKVEPFIHRCVDSILRQTFQDFELILVDDGSPDNCGRICDEYAEKDSRIRVIHQENGGLSAARNAGIDWALGYSDSQWITFVDSDDWIHIDYLKLMLNTAQKDNTSIAICKYVKRQKFQKDNIPVFFDSSCMSSRDAYTRYFYQCMTAWCKLYKKDLWKNIRFPVGKIHEDAYITHSLVFSAGKVSVLNAELYYYYYNPDSITRTQWSIRRLDEIEGHEVRLKYCKERGYTDCYISEIVALIDVLVKQITWLSMNIGSHPEFKSYYYKLRKKLRSLLRKAREFNCCLFEEEYWGVYTLAYPKKLHRIFVWLYLQIKINH